MMSRRSGSFRKSGDFYTMRGGTAVYGSSSSTCGAAGYDDSSGALGHLGSALGDDGSGSSPGAGDLALTAQL